MEYNKLKTKTDDIIVWLDVNDVGALDSVLRGMITSAQAEGQTETQYDQYWASIRALCKTLPNSPIRKGQPTALPTQVQAVADSVVNRVITAFAGITDIELVLDTVTRCVTHWVTNFNPHKRWLNTLVAVLEDF